MASYYVDNLLGLDTNDGTAPGALSGGHGAWQTNAHAIAQTLSPGDTVFIQANSAGGAHDYSTWPTTSLDQMLSSFATPTAGTAAAGWVSWVGRGGVPTIGCNGLAYYNTAFQRFVGLYFVATGSAFPALGLINGTGPTIVDGCTFFMNGQNQAGVAIQAGEIRYSTFRGATSAPGSATSGAHLIYLNNNTGTSVVGNTLFNGLDGGIVEAAGSGAVVRRNRIYKCAGDGVSTTSTTTSTATVVGSNTIDANLGHGISVTGTAGAAAVAIRDNCVTNHAGSGKYGLTFADGSTATNDARKRYVDYNNLYNNTSNYQNVSAGANDLSVNPSYAGPSTGDFTPGNALLDASSTPNVYIGAVQPAASGGGGSGPTYFAC